MLPGQGKLQSHARIMGAGGVGGRRYQREVALVIIVEVQCEHAAVSVVGLERQLDRAVAAGALRDLLPDVAAQCVLVAQ